VFLSCRSNDNSGEKKEIEQTDSMNINRNMNDNIENEKIEQSTPVTKNIIPKINPNEILSHIDKYLVSNVNYSRDSAVAGIQNGILTVKNTLTDVVFQKALVEVSIITETNEEYRTDYYTIQNIEPGDIKSVKIPSANRGVKVISHVVKVKSEKLTNGEMILVGEKYGGN
jgi:hypothetical protein